jgi:hypothetical protein
MENALGIPGGAIDSLDALTGVTAVVTPRAELTVPARSQEGGFVFGRPVPGDNGQAEVSSG